ncbi:succinylglutamate desuccinylase/aspartoacylase family protein [Micromonospora cathayae]|uniref:Succinylglutamate desuccinylase/aspartoacylase family protein n=1 Tax=Micromonospora cathayae TaxID=3028804 RepID=A0ABY7ZNJ9_9ACTN|nr:succinylglutamate desuccinylase/aspartoacylase family protein [Micromonospora sp. HUAS 3]WDZ83802.1 succinylglutamate desuccinylase/aspartoacylase family protein [Micromonospora sp. HUAS 3]
MNRVREWTVPIGRQVDGSPWPLRFVEITASAPGPTTGFVAGLWGDKPLGVLTLHELVDTLTELPLAGTVLLCPAVNLPALAAGTRVSPDHHQLNRRFPGSPTGFLTDQIAHALHATLTEHCSTVVDLHSGTPTMALRYTYDFGDLDLSVAFGQLPVVVDHAYPTQLSAVLARGGVPSCLPEFGGGPFRESTAGIAGCLNVLRYRGQLDSPLTGPPTVPVIRDLHLVLPSTTGVLVGTLGPGDVGATVPTGVLGWVTNVLTGERVEEFVVERPGGILLMASASPAMVAPGAYAFMIGFPFQERPLPATGSAPSVP